MYYELLRSARHVRTLMPAQGYLMNLLRRGSDDILYGGQDPAVVLRDVSERAQARLEHVLKIVSERREVQPIGAAP